MIDGKAADVWGLAVTLYAMIYRRLPYGKARPLPGPDQDAAFVDLCNGNFPAPPAPYPAAFKELLMSVFRTWDDPDVPARPTIAQFTAQFQAACQQLAQGAGAAGP